VAQRLSRQRALRANSSVPHFGVPNKPFENSNNRFTEFSAGGENSTPQPAETGVWFNSLPNTRSTNFGRVAVFLCVCSTYAIVCTSIGLRPCLRLGPCLRTNSLESLVPATSTELIHGSKAKKNLIAALPQLRFPAVCSERRPPILLTAAQNGLLATAFLASFQGSWTLSHDCGVSNQESRGLRAQVLSRSRERPE
jgi:hypothetical protein